MNLNIIKLKIKAKHLATEPGIIRHEERKLQGRDKYDLQQHRKINVRNEARATQLAIAYLKGIPCAKLEKRNPRKIHVFQNLILTRVLTMVRKYGSRTTSWQDVVRWSNKLMTIYEKKGYINRQDYLTDLSNEFELELGMVVELANLLGPEEDFAGLVNMLV